jgi:hypothetical protein
VLDVDSFIFTHVVLAVLSRARIAPRTKSPSLVDEINTFTQTKVSPTNLRVRTYKLHWAKLQKTNSSREYKAIQDQSGTEAVGMPEAGILVGVVGVGDMMLT